MPEHRLDAKLRRNIFQKSGAFRNNRSLVPDGTRQDEEESTEEGQERQQLDQGAGHTFGRDKGEAEDIFNEAANHTVFGFEATSKFSVDATLHDIIIEQEKAEMLSVSIRGATFPAYVKLCISSFEPNKGAVVEELKSFPKTFFGAFQWFVTTRELVGIFLQFYEKSNHNPPNRFVINSAAKTVTEVTAKLEEFKLTVLFALRYWLMTYPIHFELDRLSKNILSDFIIKEEMVLGKKHDDLFDIAKVPNHDWIRCISVRRSECRSSRKVSLIFNHLEPEQIAHHLTALEHKIMRRITFVDLKNYAINGNLDNNRTLERSVSLFNGLSQWIQCVVLSRTTPNQRADVIIKFLYVAKLLKSLKNFNSLMSVVGGLSHSSISRLTKTMDCLPSEEKKRLANYTNLLSSTSNFSAYRKAFAKASGFKIPILGVHLKDLVSVHAAHSNFLDEERQIINFCKMVQLSQVFSILQELQKTSPLRAADKGMLDNIRRVSLDTIYSEDEIYEISLIREPRVPTSTSPSRTFGTEVKADKQLQSTVDALFKIYDSDNDGFINEKEYEALYAHFPSIEPFSVLDENRDGLISKQELEKYLKKKQNSGSKHSFQEQTYYKLTFCYLCSGLLWGIVRQGYKCRNCGINAHKHCKDYMLHDCQLGGSLILNPREPQGNKRNKFGIKKKSNSHSEAECSKTPKRYCSMEVLSISLESSDISLRSETPHSSNVPSTCKSILSKRFAAMEDRSSSSLPSSPKPGSSNCPLTIWASRRNLFRLGERRTLSRSNDIECVDEESPERQVHPGTSNRPGKLSSLGSTISDSSKDGTANNDISGSTPPGPPSMRRRLSRGLVNLFSFSNSNNSRSRGYKQVSHNSSIQSTESAESSPCKKKR